MRTIDLLGQVFGRLTVIARAQRNTRFGTHAAWVCQCACGNKTIVIGRSMRVGLTRSCGCLLSEASRERQLKHGACWTREYQSWSAAKTRCYNPRIPHYANYGGRGIAMCDRWRESFEAFYADMGPCGDGCSLDRIDNNGPYSPENCRWADRITQASNTRITRLIEFNGERHTISEWERRLGFKPGALKHRLMKGWSVDRAMTQPIRRAA